MQLKSLIPSRLRNYSEDTRKPLFLNLRSSKWFIILTVSTAIFTDVFLYGIIVPVVPFALTSRANVPPDSVQHWVAILLAVYSVGLLVASPIMGWVSDRLPTRRVVLLSGLVVLSGATIMLCVGNSIGILVAGRVLQGLSASVVWTTGLALLVDTVGQREVGQTMGIISLAYSVGILVSPLLGGVVYARSGYFSVFYVAFGLIAIDIVLRLAFIEKKVAARWLNAQENVASISPALEMLPVGCEQQTGEPQRELATPSSPSFETTPGPSPRSRQLPPMLTLLSSQRLLAAFWGILVVASLTTAFDTTLPLHAHKVFGWNSLGSGLLFLALLLPSSAGPIVGRLSDKYGPRWLATVGFISALPFWILLRLVTHKNPSQIVLLCALLVLIGICIALCLPPLMAEFTYIIEAKERQRPGLFGTKGAYAQAYGLFNTAWAAGSIVGPIVTLDLQWAGFVQERAGWGTMTWSLGVLSAVSAVPVVIWTGGLISRSHAQFRVHG